MKCKYCGAPLSLEDEYCPYCGALNEAARKHTEDMKRYSRAFHKTRSQVMDRTGRQTRRHAKTLAIVILVALNVMAFSGHAAMYDLQYWWEEIQVNANENTHREALAQMEAAGQYMEMQEYYNRKGLYLADGLQEFNAVEYAAEYYARIYERIMWLADEEIEDLYYEKGELLEQIAQNVIYLYETTQPRDSVYYADQYTGLHLEAMSDIKLQVNSWLMAYCGLTKEDMEQIPSMSSQELMLLMGRRLGVYE